MLKHFGKFDPMFDVIVLSDCICWKELHQLLIDALHSIVHFIVKRNKNQHIPSIIMSYEIRKDQGEQNFFQLLTKLKWKYERVSLKGVQSMWICDELPVYRITPALQINE